EWGLASKELLAVASSYRLEPTVGESIHRNLDPFLIYFFHLKTEPDAAAKMPPPKSFWVRGLMSWEEAKVIELARHINYYAMRFDRQTPHILVHEPQASTAASPEKIIRYPFGDSFPPVIVARQLDSYLLTIWEAARSPDPFKKFLHAYQILEYVAFYYL